MRKIIFFIFIFISGSSLAQTVSIDALRREYYKINSDSATCAGLYLKITKAANSGNLFIGYKGAITAAMANHSKDKAEKLKLFKTGKTLLEQSIVSDSSNIELRFLRFTIQTNCPKILGYNTHISSDKNFILNNYASITNIAVKNMMNSFLLESNALTEEEKRKFKK